MRDGRRLRSGLRPGSPDAGTLQSWLGFILPIYNRQKLVHNDLKRMLYLFLDNPGSDSAVLHATDSAAYVQPRWQNREGDYLSVGDRHSHSHQ